MSLVWAALDNDTAFNNSTNVINNIPYLGSAGDHHTGTTWEKQITSVVTPLYKVIGNTVKAATNAVTFTPIPTTGKCLDNKKKIAVYMAAMTNSVHSETTQSDVNVPVTYDPLTTAMFFEYNPDYLGDSNIASKLTTRNYDLLIVPMSQISTTAASAISTYISNGGSVWFLNDPCMAPDGTSSAQLTNLLGSGVSASLDSSKTINVVNTDSITNGLSDSFNPVGTTAKTAEFRSLSGSGTIAGLSYQVLMSSGSNALLVKFENSTTGARVIYSNPNMFISGGTSSYFNAQTATKLFTQTKTWIMKFAQNPSIIGITYPGGDKQLTVTMDDVQCSSFDDHTTQLFDNETSVGITPSTVNTFYIIPNPDFDKNEVKYYARYGDTHTIHAHQYYDSANNTWYDCDWDVNSTSVATYDNNISSLKNFFNKIMGTSDYGFTSWRFPMTTFCANSMQAVSDSDFTIDSSNGNAGDGVLIGNQADNNIFFPEQVLVNNAKSNLIEFELDSAFDIDCADGTEYYNGYNTYTSQFATVNFPANFIIAGHYQGIGMDGLTSWGVNATGLTAGLRKILVAEKAANPNYATINTLSKYISRVKSANVTATYDGTSTTVSILNTKPITGFTLKAGAGGVKSATCDGSAVAIHTDSLTGALYITKDLTPGSHVFVIS